MNGPNLRQSCLKHIVSSCEYRYTLSQKHGIETTDAMREGVIFENLVFGIKDRNKYDSAVGRKKVDTIEFIDKQAVQIKERFNFEKEWVSHTRFETEYRGNVVAGEFDYLGEGWFEKGFEFGIWDLKYTQAMFNNWESLDTFTHFQAVEYTYIYWKLKGKVVPFFYVIVDGRFQNPIVKVRKVVTCEDDFKWFESIMDKAIDYPILEPNPGIGTCTDRFTPCKYIEYCIYGREFIGSYEKHNFKDYWSI